MRFFRFLLGREVRSLEFDVIEPDVVFLSIAGLRMVIEDSARVAASWGNEVEGACGSILDEGVGDGRQSVEVDAIGGDFSIETNKDFIAFDAVVSPLCLRGFFLRQLDGNRGQFLLPCCRGQKLDRIRDVRLPSVVNSGVREESAH